MTAAIQVAGAATIKVDTGSVNALEILGWTADGAHIDFEGFFLDVPTDENGGESGPPADIQYLGETARIRLELTKWDTTVEDKITSRVRGTSAGVVATPGTLLIGGGLTTRLLILTTARPINFPVCVFREPIEINKGTKYSRLVISATAYKNGSGVLHNATTS